MFYYNKKYNIKFILKKKNKVYLLYCNIKIKRLSDKLNYKKLKSFKIKRILKLINYKLILFKTINIYLIFYIFLLKLVFLSVFITLIIKINLINLNVKYKVKIILNC